MTPYQNDMMDMNEHQVDVECPSCKGNVVCAMGQIADQETVICPHCNEEIKFVDEEGGMRNQLDELNRAFDKLDKSLRGLGNG